MVPCILPAWAQEMAWVSSEDKDFPVTIDGSNLVLNRMRLAAFLGKFSEDQDVADLLSLDAIAAASGIPLTSTGLSEYGLGLATRPFRVWEYIWLYKSLRLSAGGRTVLDLGGPATHLSILAALAGCQVTSIDINPEFIQAAHDCAEALRLTTLHPCLGDMRDLSAFSSDGFDVVISCSVLEHLTAADQKIAIREMERVLKPGGIIGLTFDFGKPAPGANQYLPPPHDPPQNSAEALDRFLQPGLVVTGNPFVENPIAGSLFRDDTVRYTVASLFLGKAPLQEVQVPVPENREPVVNRLRVGNLPYRIQRRASVWAQAAAGQLAAMREKDRTIERLRAELQTQSEAAAAKAQQQDQELREPLRQLEAAAAMARAQDERSKLFETAAEERLVLLQEKDQELRELLRQLEAAAAMARAQDERSKLLETAAEERLVLLQEKDQELRELLRQLETAAGESEEQRKRITEFQQILSEIKGQIYSD